LQSDGLAALRAKHTSSMQLALAFVGQSSLNFGTCLFIARFNRNNIRAYRLSQKHPKGAVLCPTWSGGNPQISDEHFKLDPFLIMRQSLADLHWWPPCEHTDDKKRGCVKNATIS